MKRIALLALVAFGLQVQAQDMSGIIKTNPLGWLAGQYQFGYEHFLSEKASVQLLPGGIYGSITLFPNDSTSNLTSVGAGRAGVIVVPEFRYYFAGDAPDGMYIAPFGRYRSVTTTLNNDGGTGGWHFWSSPGSGSGYEGAVWQGDAGTDHVHIVLTVNGSAIRMYKDGEFADSYTATSGWPVGNYEWELNGQRGAFNTNFMFDGWFKDLSVWTNRVLTPHEVSVLYDLGHGGSY